MIDVLFSSLHIVSSGIESLMLSTEPTLYR